MVTPSHGEGSESLREKVGRTIAIGVGRGFTSLEIADRILSLVGEAPGREWEIEGNEDVENEPFFTSGPMLQPGERVRVREVPKEGET